MSETFDLNFLIIFLPDFYSCKAWFESYISDYLE